MVERQLHVREQARQCSDHHDQRNDPVDRNDALDPVEHKTLRAQRPTIAHDPHDKAADDEEDVYARRADIEAAAAPLGRMKEDDREGRKSTKVLDSVKRLHQLIGAPSARPTEYAIKKGCRWHPVRIARTPSGRSRSAPRPAARAAR